MLAYRPALGKVHSSRLQNLPDGPKKPQRSRPRVENDEVSDSHSIGALKNSVRNLERLLQHNDKMPANVRAEKERALESYRSDLEKACEIRDNKKIIRRWHGVRFFERQKATRTLKKLKTSLSSLDPSTAEHSALLQQIHEAEVDLNYTQFCPLLERYQNLWPNGKNSPSSGNNISGKKSEMWFLIEKAMAEGILEEIRNRRGRRKVKREEGEDHRGGQERQRQSRGAENKREDVEDSHSSDGGFFEE